MLDSGRLKTDAVTKFAKMSHFFGFLVAFWEPSMQFREFKKCVGFERSVIGRLLSHVCKKSF